MIESIQLSNGMTKITSTSGIIHKLSTDAYSPSFVMLPSDTMDMYEEVDEKPLYTKEEYKIKVRELIAERYAIEDEIALYRQKDRKSAEFAEYDNFCEECKRKAHITLSSKDSGDNELNLEE